MSSSNTHGLVKDRTGRPGGRRVACAIASSTLLSNGLPGGAKHSSKVRGVTSNSVAWWEVPPRGQGQEWQV